MLLDLPLLRSVFVQPGDSQADALANLQSLRRDVVLDGLDRHLIEFAGKLADKAQRGIDLSLMLQHYQQLQATGDPNGMAGVIRLTEVQTAGLPFQDAVAFRYALDQHRDRTLSDGLGIVLQQVSHILTSGYTYTPPKGKPTTLKGPVDAIRFIEQGISQVASQFKSGDVEGTLRDLQQVISRYQIRAGAPKHGGVHTGYKIIDDAHDGFEPGDLALILGYTGQMKSMIAVNMAYHAAVWYGHNVAFMPLESSVKALQDMLAVMHCYHKKFNAGLVAITYTRLKKGTLGPMELQLLAEATHDLATCGDYGQMVYMEPERPQTTVGDVFRWAEAKNQQVSLALLVLDYAGLVDPTGGGSSMKESAFANMTVREIKQRSMSFNGGKGIATLSPWQSNRKGYSEAVKNGGKYELTALAWAPEAEKSADLVYYVFRDDTLATSNQLQVGNLKARDRQLILDSFLVYADASTRVIEDIDQSQTHQQVVPGLNQP